MRRGAVYLSCVLVGLALIAPAAAAPNDAAGQDQPTLTGSTVEFVSPLPAGLRALAIAAYMDDDEFVEGYPDRDKRLKAIETLSGVFVDIDDSGEPAAFIHRNGKVWTCGSIGCTVDVFKKHGKAWQHAGDFPDRGDEFVVYDIKDNGGHRLQTYMDNNYRPADILWSGKAYKDPADPDPPQTPIVCDDPTCP